MSVYQICSYSEVTNPKEFYQILISLPFIVRRVFDFIQKFPYEQVFPSVATMADALNTSERTIKRCTWLLQKIGVLTKFKRAYTTSVYILNSIFEKCDVWNPKNYITKKHFSQGRGPTCGPISCSSKFKTGIPQAGTPIHGIGEREKELTPEQNARINHRLKKLPLTPWQMWKISTEFGDGYIEKAVNALRWYVEEKGNVIETWYGIVKNRCNYYFKGKK